MTSSLILNSVDLSFGKKQVLSDVSLTCSTGEILAIFGRNGSGKSTLLKILFGMLRPKTMELYINGNRIERVSTKSKLVAYLPQAPFLPKDLTARQIIPMYFRWGNAGQDILHAPN